MNQPQKEAHSQAARKKNTKNRPAQGATSPRRPAAAKAGTLPLDVIIHNDCLKELRKLPDNVIDMLGVDPPYGYGFMGEAWDAGVLSVEVWQEVLRVLKPGALGFVMSAPRQDVLAQMIVNLGKAGFDTSLTSIYWTYASGFPKSVSMSNVIEKHNAEGKAPVDAKAAAALQGAHRGFQPKPAVEVVLVVMKPLAERTYLDQALANGKGVSWFGDTQIPVVGLDSRSAGNRTANFGTQQTTSGGNGSAPYVPSEKGRFPANLLVSDDVLDDGSITTSRPSKGGGQLNGGGVAGGGLHAGGIKQRMGSSISDSGGFSRYFSLDAWWVERSKYLPEEVRDNLPFLVVPKPSKKEKNAGVEGRKRTTTNDGRKKTNDTAFQQGATERCNSHPTVKPVKLMSYLITLGSRPGDVLLDITCGSGTTCVAAAMLDRHYIGIEADADYAAIARARVTAVTKAQSAKSVTAPKPATKKGTARSGKATSRRSTSSPARASRKPAKSSPARPADARRSQPSAPGRMTAGELFAGVGGFRLGLGRSGWDTVFSNQWEPGTAAQHASETYTHNFGDAGHHNEDITTLLDRGLDDRTVIPELTLLCGGFPCVDYSVAKPLSQSKGLQGEKGQLWWQVQRLLEHRRPPFVLLENVDRLLKSPAAQRGRDFAVILRSLTDLGYAVEWRVVNSSDYGFPQRRRRIFIVATNTQVLPVPAKFDVAAVIGRSGVLARALPVASIARDVLSTFSIDGTLDEVGRDFGEGLKRSPFLDAGFALGHQVHCCAAKPDYQGPLATLRSVLLDERRVSEHFFIDRMELPAWRYLKGAKRLKRTRPDGSDYIYTEGSVAFPDASNRPSRTLLTSEGSSSASRTTHVVKCGNRRHRRLTPVELERLNGFPDDWTKLRSADVENSDVRRGFLMGNALVVGLVERIGAVLAADWTAHTATTPKNSPAVVIEATSDPTPMPEVGTTTEERRAA